MVLYFTIYRRYISIKVKKNPIAIGGKYNIYTYMTLKICWKAKIANHQPYFIQFFDFNAKNI